MDKEFKRMLDRAIEIAKNTPPPSENLIRRTYFVGRSKRIFHPYPRNDCTSYVEY